MLLEFWVNLGRIKHRRLSIHRLQSPNHAIYPQRFRFHLRKSSGQRREATNKRETMNLVDPRPFLRFLGVKWSRGAVSSGNYAWWADSAKKENTLYGAFVEHMRHECPPQGNCVVRLMMNPFSPSLVTEKQDLAHKDQSLFRGKGRVSLIHMLEGGGPVVIQTLVSALASISSSLCFLLWLLSPSLAPTWCHHSFT